MIKRKWIHNLWYLGFIGFLGSIFDALKSLKILFLFFLTPFVSSLIRTIIGKKKKQYRKLQISLLDFFCHPKLLIQILIHLLGQTIAFLRIKGSPPSPDKFKPNTSFSLPFEGFWTVVNGGITKENSHSWNVLNQRYAYDFLILDDNGKTYRNKGNKLDDYFAFGKPVLAPADGIVIQVQNHIPDNPQPGTIDVGAKDFRGNFVIIKHSDIEYSFLAHLQYGSIRVKVGDRVVKGQLIGLCGNSGHSTEPHLHFHVQDHPNFFLAVSLPIMFEDFYRRQGDKISFLKRGYISKGWQIKPK
ncbi:MAG: M23 family metallopeptidase [Calditrichaeota bacterium]|nr:M23 family metallopeptidase [Calditrichota bacterium]